MENTGDQSIRAAIRKRIEASAQYRIGPYRYFVWPYKGLSAIEPPEVSYLVGELSRLVPSSTDLIVSFMVDGSILALPLALHLQIPVVVFRDHHYNMQDPVKILQKTRYFTRNLYIERPKQPSRVCIVDAIISTGATIIAAAEALRHAQCQISGVIAAVAKRHYGGIERIINELKVDPAVIYNIRYEGDGMLAIEESS